MSPMIRKEPLPPTLPYFRESGAGPGVVCLHANASSSSQWRALTELLESRYRVLAPDSYGAGRTPGWTSRAPLSLRDEAALLEPVFERAGSPFALVAHSYGAAIALIAAVERPGRVAALVIYEPTLFSLVDAESPPPNEADGIRDAVARAAAALDLGDRDGAARHFIDFWMGAGAWAAMSERRQGPISDSIACVRLWAAALMGETTPLEAFARLDIPVLLMLGSESPASSLSVTRLLARALPRASTVRFPGLGHMGPVTHPDVVNAAILAFLASEWAQGPARCATVEGDGENTSPSAEG